MSNISTITDLIKKIIYLNHLNTLSIDNRKILDKWINNCKKSSNNEKYYLIKKINDIKKKKLELKLMKKINE